MSGRLRSRSMGITDVSISNLRRRKGRAIFLFVSLCLAIATFVAVSAATNSMQVDLGRKMDAFGANVVITPSLLEAPVSYGGVAVGGIIPEAGFMEESDANKIFTIRNRENVNVVSPKIIGRTEVEGRGMALAGVLFSEELGLKHWWQLEGAQPAQPNEVMLGSSASLALAKRPGDSLAIKGQQFTVAGVLNELGGPEDNYVFADLHQAQGILGFPGKVSIIELSAWCGNCPVEEIVQQISAKIPGVKVVAVKQAIAGKRLAVDTVGRFSLIISGLVLAVAVLIVLTSMMSAVSERTREIGLLRALGYRRQDIVRILLTEAELSAIGAGVVGFVLGTVSAQVLSGWALGWDIQVAWSLVLGFEALLIASVAAGVGAAYPSWQAAELDPATALRFV